jgi:probable F420-dependent oxidoreductase
MTRPFRFAATLPPPDPPLTAWRDSLRRLEDLGVDTLVAADHFTQGYEAEPMIALTAAAGATTSARLQTGVLGNDYRHPVLVHRMAALLDVVSEGRFVLGLGAGWMTSDYEAAGIPLDDAAVRVDRFEESIRVIKGLFGDAPFSFDGAHYRIDALDGLPKPVQRPHPPFFLGGGSPRVLRIAGREGDVVGVNASLKAGELGEHAIRDLAADRVLKKIGWVREGATSAGRGPDDLELEMNHWLARVTATAGEADEYLARVAGRYGVEPALLTDSPSVLVGTVEQCIDTLQARRERFGFNVLQLDAGFQNPGLDDFGPVIAALNGT